MLMVIVRDQKWLSPLGRHSDCVRYLSRLRHSSFGHCMTRVGGQLGTVFQLQMPMDGQLHDFHLHRLMHL